MPLYEYACTSCESHFEVRQRVADEPISVCPTCGGRTRRVFHPVGIIFKGSGWYSTDSRQSTSATSTAEPEKADTGKPAADGATTASTPAASSGTSAEPRKSSPASETKKSSPGSTSD